MRNNIGIEQQYLASLRQILAEGEEKHPERKLEAGRKLSHYTKGVTDKVFTHYMDDGFPLFTTKKMGLKNIATELEFFIKGLTDKQWLKDRNCHIWDSWANPHCGVNPEEENDLGPLGYSWQMRQFDEHYTYDNGPKEYWQRIGNDYEVNGVEKGFDQLKDLVDTLKTNPNDRRMVVSAWNPNQFHMMALPPCHILWGVSHYNGCLDLRFIMRSTDAYLGFPYNIASYGLLLLLLAKESGFKARKLTAVCFDYHLYSNQFDVVEQQLKREPFALPRVEITGNKSIFDWTYKDLALYNYTHHPALERVDVVV